MDELFRIINKYSWVRFLPIVFFGIIFVVVGLLMFFSINTTPLSKKASNSTQVTANIVDYRITNQTTTPFSVYYTFSFELNYEVNGQTYTSTIKHKSKEQNAQSTIDVYVDNDTFEVLINDYIFGLNAVIAKPAITILTFVLYTLGSIYFVKKINEY